MEKEHEKTHKFVKNSKYLTVSIYALGVILFGCIIFRLIYNWTRTVAFIHHLMGVLSPFLAGLLIAYMISPLINCFYEKLFLERLKMKKKGIAKMISVFLSYAIVMGLLAVCMNSVIPQLIESVAELTTSIPDIYNTIMDRVTNLTKNGQNMNTPGLINVLINQNMPKAYSYLENFMGKSLPMLYDFSMQAIKGVVNLFIALIISIYLSFDKNILLLAFKKLIYAVLPVKEANSLTKTFRECNQIFSNYLVGKAVDSIIIGILCFVIMSILKLPLTVLISIIVGITNMIPYFGPFIGAIPGVFLIALLSPFGAVKFAIMIFLIQQFDGYILGPRILGGSTGVRPITILFAVLVGGAYFGALGMFLGVPVVVVVQHLIAQWMDRRLEEKDILVELSEERKE